MSILSNIDIEKLCAKMKVPLVKCDCKDKLPKRLRNGAYVINLANSNQPGTHWTAFIIETKTKTCAYFDSFGIPPPQEVLKFAVKCKHIFYDTRPIQDINAVTCGWYCVAFLHFMTHYTGKLSEKMEYFNQMFDKDDLENNNQILMNYFDKNI